MKTIKIGVKEIKLNVNTPITVGDIRKIQPVITKYTGNDGQTKQGQEIEMAIDLLKTISDLTDEEINNFTIDEFTEISKEIEKLLNVEESKKKISQ